MAKIQRVIHGTKFDSVLALPKGKTALGNCTLTLNLRMYLVRRDVKKITRKKKVEKCRDWSDDEWKSFVRKVERLPERHFNNTFWLVPPSGYSGLDYPADKPHYRPRVKCALNIIILDDKKRRKHIKIKAVHLADGNDYMRSHSRLYDHHDIEEDESEHKQITVVHEVGHALDLDHPGIRKGVRACLKDGNRDECYEPENELMADGMTMIKEYAAPWQKQIAKHTKTKAKNWRVLMRPEPAEPLSFIEFRDKSTDRMRERLFRSIEGI